MIGRRMANIIKRFARHRDDMRLGNLQRVRSLDARANCGRNLLLFFRFDFRDLFPILYLALERFHK